MADLRKPGVYLTEEVVTPMQNYNGKIPCFIGATSADSGEIGTPEEFIQANNRQDFIYQVGKPMEALYCGLVMTQFYDELEGYKSDYGAPYIYFIDVGDGKTITSWNDAMETALSLNDIDCIFFIGVENLPYGQDLELMTRVSSSLEESHKRFESIQAAFTIREDISKTDKAFDEDLILTAKGISVPRVNFIEPRNYGKFLANICITPFYEEIGSIPFSTVEVGEFANRTHAKIEEMMNHGVIIGVDEKVRKNDFVPKINLAVSTHIDRPVTPADAILSRRLIADAFLDASYEVLYKYIKSREMTSQIPSAQSALDSLIDKWVNANYILPVSDKTPNGSYALVYESNSNPNYMVIQTHILPVNSVIAIENEVTIESKQNKVEGE